MNNGLMDTALSLRSKGELMKAARFLESRGISFELAAIALVGYSAARRQFDLPYEPFIKDRG